MCQSVGEALTARKDPVSVTEASDALRQAREFISEANGPPESEKEQERLTSTLFALDYTSRLAEVAGESRELASAGSEPEDVLAAELCAGAMRYAAVIAGQVGSLPIVAEQGVAHEAAVDHPFVQLEHCAKTLRELQPVHRTETIRSVGAGAVTADEALASVETVRRLEAIAHHAWRSASHLVDSRSQFSDA